MAEKKTLDYYMALPYQEVIVAAKEGGYVGYIPAHKIGEMSHFHQKSI